MIKHTYLYLQTETTLNHRSCIIPGEYIMISHKYLGYRVHMTAAVSYVVLLIGRY